jgi:hypothetical protein
MSHALDECKPAGNAGSDQVAYYLITDGNGTFQAESCSNCLDRVSR